MTTLIDGRKIARQIRGRVADQTARVGESGPVPGLATVLVGDDAASAVYVAAKRRAIREAGMQDVHRRLPADASQGDVARILDELAAQPDVTGILLQLPLPGHLDAAELIDRIPAGKDVDGLTTTSVGLLTRGAHGLRPCTPAGIMELLDAEGVALRGARAVVVGHSALVGRPMARMLLERDATVTVAHRHTRQLATVTRTADVLVVAAGVPRLIGAQHVRPGAVVVDVGIHRTEAGLVGDVRADELNGHAGLLTPVPGGVGPMTIAMLLANTLKAAQLSQDSR